MAGEILTSGLVFEPEISFTRFLSNLDEINVSHAVGMLSFNLYLSFVVGKSNIMQYAIYSKELGSSTWVLYNSGYLDARDGVDKEVTIESLQNCAWLIAIMPMEYVVRKVDCTITVKAMYRKNLSAPHVGSNKNKKLRICNNMKVVTEAEKAAFDSWSNIPNLSSSVNHKMTTSVGTLMKNGQYIFGKN